MVLPTRNRFSIILYLAAAFLFWSALYFYVPTLPLYAKTRTDDLALIGTALAQYGFWQFFIRIPLGVASDWLGRRKLFIYLGLCLAACGALIMNFSTGIVGLIAGRAVTGLAAGAWVPIMVVFSSLFPVEEMVRAAGLMSATCAIGRMVATGLNGSLNNLGGYSLAFFAAVAAAALAALVVFPAKEERRPRQSISMRSIGRLITRRQVLVPSIISAVLHYGIWGSTYGFLPLLVKEFGGTGVAQSLMISMNLAVVMAGNLVVTGLAKRTGIKPMIYFSFATIAAGLLLSTVSNSLAWLVVAQILIGLGEGAGYPVLIGLSMQAVDDRDRSTATGAHQSIYAIGMFSGPWLSGILAAVIGLRPMFAVTAIIVLVLGIGSTKIFLNLKTPKEGVTIPQGCCPEEPGA